MEFIRKRLIKITKHHASEKSVFFYLADGSKKKRRIFTYWAKVKSKRDERKKKGEETSYVDDLRWIHSLESPVYR